MFRHTSASALPNSMRGGMKGDAIISQADHGAEVKTTRRVQGGKFAGPIHMTVHFSEYMQQLRGRRRQHIGKPQVKHCTSEYITPRGCTVHVPPQNQRTRKCTTHV